MASPRPPKWFPQVFHRVLSWAHSSLYYTSMGSNLPLSSNSSLILYANDMLLYKPIDSSSDYFSIQADLNAIYDWLSSKLLNLNLSKLMFFSHKPSSLSNSYSPLQINRNDLLCVTEFRYLGVILTQSFFLYLSHLIHLLQIPKILGLIFCHFYKHSSPETIIRLYTSLVRPILEYCSLVWSPSSSSQTIELESIQSFAIKLAYKFCPPPQPLNLHSLSSRRTYPRLKILFTISCNLSFFPLPVFKPYTPPHLPHPFLSPQKLRPFHLSHLIILQVLLSFYY